MTASSSGDGVWPTRGTEASGLKCPEKQTEEKMGRGKGCRGGGVTTQRWEESTHPAHCSVKTGRDIIMQYTHISAMDAG